MIRWIFTFVLLPFFSFSLTRGCNLFSSNFSSISIALHRRGEFFLWCLLCGGFFYSQLSLYRPRQAKCCLLLLTAAALLPYAPEHLPVCAILHTLLALAAALLFLYNLFYLSLQLYFSSPASVHYSQRTSNTAFFSKLTHSLDSPATRGRLCLLLLWISSVFCLDSWILSGIINSAMEICLALHRIIRFFPYPQISEPSAWHSGLTYSSAFPVVIPCSHAQKFLRQWIFACWPCFHGQRSKCAY